MTKDYRCSDCFNNDYDYCSVCRDAVEGAKTHLVINLEKLNENVNYTVDKMTVYCGSTALDYEIRNNDWVLIKKRII